MDESRLPVAVVGAGPVGLAAAAQLVLRGEKPVVLEAGDSAGANVLKWGHVRLFSPWRYVVDRACALLLERAGWTPPPGEAFPTGRELVEGYLQPLAGVPELRSAIVTGARVVSISRLGFDKLKTEGREDAPFVLRIQRSGREETVLARAVIDASGTYQRPNPLGNSGTPALGEAPLADRVFYGIPDVRGGQRGRYAGKRVLVVGSGHSAFNAVLDLRELASTGTEVAWAIRRTAIGQLFGGQKKDGLQERGRLGTRVRELVESDQVELLLGFAPASIQPSGGRVQVASGDGRTIVVDEVIATTGFRPDAEMTRELRLALDPAVESPAALAPLIDPNVHSCGTVPPHGAGELAHPEKDFYVVGMKSYGRAPTFLMLTGYEQVRSVVAALAGDWESARKVELVLPETGVCSTDGRGSCDLPAPGAAAGCCTAAAEATAQARCCA